MNEFRVVVAADICPNHGLDSELIEKGGDTFIEPVKPLFDRADLVIGNLETPLCDEESPIPKCGPNFITKPAVAGVLKEMGFDCLTLANNHVNDQGLQGLEQTLQVLRSEGMPHCGGGMTHEDACRPAEFDMDGRRVAVFNFGEGEFSQALENGPGTARVEGLWPELRVQRCREAFDTIIAVLHVGNEYQPIPSQVTADFCRRMAAAGADAVIGHHAHIPQCAEVFEGVPICFSLGNFLFGYPFMEERFEANPSWYLVTVAEVVFADGRPAEMVLHPFKQLGDRSLAELSPAGREAFDEYMQRCEAIMSDPSEHQRFWEQEARNLFRSHRKNLPEYARNLNSEDEAVSHRAATVLYNLVRCDAHHEALQRGFRLMYEGRLDDDQEAQAELDTLRRLIRECFRD